MLLQLYTWYVSFHISLWNVATTDSTVRIHWRKINVCYWTYTKIRSGYLAQKIPPSKDLIGNNFIFSDRCRMHVKRRREGNKTEAKHSKQWWFTKPRILIFSMNHRIMKKNRHVRVMFAMVFCCSVFAFSTCARGLPLIVRAHPFVRWCLVNGSTLKARFSAVSINQIMCSSSHDSNQSNQSNQPDTIQIIPSF